ncbi:hypothetical protein RCL1_008808 [Eukaryota sp. TZLM3-RCL]
MHDSLHCPISAELMKDAVITPYGHSFSLKSISEWLETNTVCPITRKPLSTSSLIPNYALRDFIAYISSTPSATRPLTVQASSKCVFENFIKDSKSMSALSFKLAELKNKKMEVETRLQSAAAERARLSELLLSNEAHPSQHEFMKKRMNDCETEENSLYVTIVGLDYDVKELQTRYNSLKVRVEEGRRELDSSLNVSLSQEEVDKILEEDRRNELINSALEVKSQGDLLFKQGKYNEAIHQYTTAIDMLKSNPLSVLYLNRAAAHQMLKQYNEAISDAQKAIEIDPRNGKAYRRLGATYIYLNELTKASIAYTQALDIDENDSEAKKMLKVLEEKMKSKNSRQHQEQGYSPQGHPFIPQGIPRALVSPFAFFDSFVPEVFSFLPPRPFDDGFFSFLGL